MTVAIAMVIAAGGCVNHNRPEAPLGSISDSIWQWHEHNAEASDFVIHEHEFDGNTSRLNTLGESHVRQVAARMQETSFPVIIQQSSMSTREDDEHGFPVHGDTALDQRRREVIVHTLIELGAKDVENKVVVAPALTPGFELIQAEAAYYRAINGASRGGRGQGGGSGFGGGGGGGFLR